MSDSLQDESALHCTRPRSSKQSNCQRYPAPSTVPSAVPSAAPSIKGTGQAAACLGEDDGGFLLW